MVAKIGCSTPPLNSTSILDRARTIFLSSLSDVVTGVIEGGKAEGIGGRKEGSCAKSRHFFRTIPAQACSRFAWERFRKVRSGVWLDETSARPLERRFMVTIKEGTALLTGEEHSDDEACPLLGKPTQ